MNIRSGTFDFKIFSEFSGDDGPGIRQHSRHHRPCKHQ
jgi:hypothetical protein